MGSTLHSSKISATCTERSLSGAAYRRSNNLNWPSQHMSRWLAWLTVIYSSAVAAVFKYNSKTSNAVGDLFDIGIIQKWSPVFFFSRELVSKNGA